MTRKKKSRKPGVAPISANNSFSKKSSDSSHKKLKKHKGKRPGNRQLEAEKKQRQQKIPSGKKDPRLGSKKAIQLQPTAKTTEVKQQRPLKSVQQNSAPIDNTEKWMQELESIEQNEKLLSIIEKQQQETELTDSEVDFFNELMDRYQTLQQLLGIDDEGDEDDEFSATSTSDENDEALWQRWDANEFNDFNDSESNK